MPVHRKNGRKSRREQRVERTVHGFLELLRDEPARPAGRRSTAKRPAAPRPKPKMRTRRRSIPHWDATSRTLWFGRRSSRSSKSRPKTKN